MSRLFPVGRRIVRSGREVGAAETGRADGKPPAARGIVGSVLQGVASSWRRRSLLGGGSCAAGAKLASWNGKMMAARGIVGQCLAGRRVFVASAFPCWAADHAQRGRCRTFKVFRISEYLSIG